jgi:hypothetical protein
VVAQVTLYGGTPPDEDYVGGGGWLALGAGLLLWAGAVVGATWVLVYVVGVGC